MSWAFQIFPGMSQNLHSFGLISCRRSQSQHPASFSGLPIMKEFAVTLIVRVPILLLNSEGDMESGVDCRSCFGVMPTIIGEYSEIIQRREVDYATTFTVSSFLRFLDM